MGYISLLMYAVDILFSCICIYYISNVHKMTATVYFILACAITFHR